MPTPVRLHRLAELSAEETAALMVREEASLDRYIEPARAIVEAVRVEGDAALARFANEFDKSAVTPETIKAGEDEFEHAFATIEPDVKAGIEFAVANIREFHTRQMPEPMWMHEVRPGAFAGERWRPIPSVALYVPRGKGCFPSVAMMTSIPAVVAGVPEIAIVTPPGPDGRVDAGTLVAARIAGVENVYKCGGAQAVAAVAYGTATVPRCGKLVGPGSPWVLAGKALLSHLIDPGTPAGPSESIVLADHTANPRLAALDLLIEAEHGADSSAFLVTESEAVAEAAIAAIPGYWAQMGAQRVEFSSAVLGSTRGGVVLAPDWDAAVAFTNTYAPEHLLIHSADPFSHLGRITDAGEILLGEHTPLTLANFVLGPNAVLPTGGHARNWSPLSVYDFLKATGIGYVTAEGYKTLAPHARRLALYEGFDAHANAIGPTREAARRP
ncbi:MAG: histidinol dehydrogenase [Rhodospirillaceae bacterium]|nr:histidinol dehydrogenase [Rhodospirillaceae bacterium]